MTNDFRCEIGEVLNCDKYVDFSNTQCEKCLDGFALFKGFEDYCYKIDDSLLCKDANIRSNTIYGAEIECVECNNPEDLVTSNLEDIPFPTKCL